MKAIIIFIIMIYLHIFDDFVLQNKLAEFKQKKFWEKYDKRYHNDYKISLILHSISWTISINIPILYLLWNNQTNDKMVEFLILDFIFNIIIHCTVDNTKANKLIINLCEDQFFHMLQIFMTWVIWSDVFRNCGIL